MKALNLLHSNLIFRNVNRAPAYLGHSGVKLGTLLPSNPGFIDLIKLLELRCDLRLKTWVISCVSVSATIKNKLKRTLKVSQFGFSSDSFPLSSAGRWT